MASQDRIKAINAEAKAKENLKKVEADLAKMEKANAEKRNTYSQQEIADLEEKKKKVEAYLEKVKGIKEEVESFKETADSISLSSRATSSLSTALGTLVKNFKAISSIDIKQNLDSVELEFVNTFQEGASKFLSAQQDLMNADPSDKETFAQYEKDLDISKQFLDDLIKDNGTLLSQNTQLNQYVQDFAKGMGSVAQQVGITKNLSAEELEQYKELTAEADKMSTRFKAVGNQITAAFKKPNVLIGLMFVGLGKVADAVGKTTREMGGFVGGLTGATTQVTALSVVFPQALESAKGLSSEFGGLADTSFDTQLNTNLLATNLGVSGKEAAQLVGQFARLNNGSVGTAENLIVSTKELAKQKGLIPSQVMADVAGSAQAFAEYGKAGGTNIAEAAVAAGQLGSNLDGVTKVTNQLLDFENSINQELELGARLGKNINFQEARRLAYQGDIKGSIQAALQQMGGIEGFNRMDIFQKRAAAAALGLQTDELQKMLSNMDKLNKDGSIQQSTFSQMGEALTAFSTSFGGQLLKSIGYLTMALPFLKDGLKMLGPLGKVIAAPFKGLLFVVNKTLSGLKFMVVESGKFLLNMMKAAAQKLGFGGSEIAGGAKDAFTLAKEKGLSDKQILSGFGGKEAKDMMQVPESVTDKAKDSISDKVEDKISDKVEDVELPGDDLPKSSFGDKLKDLSEGLSAMGTPQVLFGALNLIPTGIGFIGILPGIPGMAAVGALGKFAGKGLMGLAEGLVAMTPTLAGAGALALAGLGFTLMIPGAIGMGLVGALGAFASSGLVALSVGLLAMTPTLLGSASLIAAGIGFTLMALGSPGMLAVGLLGPLASFGLSALAIGLTIFGTAAANPLLWLGIGAIGALGLALIPLAYSMSLLTPLVSAFGEVITTTFSGLGRLFDSVTTSISNFMESITLGQIASIGLLSLAFIGLAGSLMFLGTAGLFALPTLLGIAAASAGIALVAEVFGFAGDGNKSEETTALESESVSTFEKDVLDKIDNLITAVGNGMQVNLDGRRVNQGLERSNGRSLQNNILGN